MEAAVEGAVAVVQRARGVEGTSRWLLLDHALSLPFANLLCLPAGVACPDMQQRVSFADILARKNLPRVLAQRQALRV